MLAGRITCEGTAEMTSTFDKISYGFVNIGYFFPQMSIDQGQVGPIFTQVTNKLIQYGHFGNV